MTFFKFLRSDMKSGVLMQWKKYLITYFIFIVFSIIHYLDIGIINLSNPQYLINPPTWGDYLLSLVCGSSKFDPSLAGTIFQLPVLWVILFLSVLFITLYYPYDDLMGWGKTALILSGSRSSWWFSKCIWVIVSVFCYIFTFFAATFTVASLSGAELSFRISEYLPADLGFDNTILISPPWQIGKLLVGFVAVIIALCLIQLFLSLLIRPIFSYILVSAYVVASAYFQSPFLLGNYAMAARSELFVTDNVNFSSGILICIWSVGISVLIGNLVFGHMDILSKE